MSSTDSVTSTCFHTACDSPGSPGTGSPAAVLCMRPRCCPPCASLHAAELKGQDDRRQQINTWSFRFLFLRSTLFFTWQNTVIVPLFRSSSSSSSSFPFFLPSSCLPESVLLSLATHWISPPVSCHSPLWSNAGFGASLMRSSVCASARTAARSRWRNSWTGQIRGTFA